MLLCAAVALRAATLALYFPGVVLHPDAMRFARVAPGVSGIFDDVWLPAMYPIFLHTLRVISDQVWFTIAAQHLLGLLAGTALYLAVATRAAPGTIWHGVSETVRLDAIATALGGTAASWPVPEASAELGPLADLFTRDQDVSSAKTRAVLDWTPARISIIKYLTA